MAGAAFGRGQRLLGVARDLSEGDTERALDKMRVMTPLLNTLPISILSYMYEVYT